MLLAACKKKLDTQSNKRDFNEAENILLAQAKRRHGNEIRK